MGTSLADYATLEYDPDPVGIIDPTMVPHRDVPECAVLCFFSEVVTKLSADIRECFKMRAQHGTHVGLVGSTGLSIGAHLHIELEVGGVPADPGTPIGC